MYFNVEKNYIEQRELYLIENELTISCNIMEWLKPISA